MNRLCFLLAIALTPAPLSAAEPALARFSHKEPHMGVEFEVVLYAATSTQANEALRRAMARIAELDKALSDYDLTSELSRLSATSQSVATPPPFPAIPLSDDLWCVLNESQALSAASGGAFDITLGPLTKLWRRARRWKELPDANLLAAARAAVGYQHLELHPKTKSARLLVPNMRLDLGGIAKGYAADQALATIRQLGIEQALVRASGDIAVGAPPPDEQGWQVAIAPLDPRAAPTQFLRLADAAVSTSGDANQHLVVAGRRYSHILDPRTLEPVTGRSSVTVVAPRGITADGLATAASVLGPTNALDLLPKFPAAELLLVHENENGVQQTTTSPGFAKYLAP